MRDIILLTWALLAALSFNAFGHTASAPVSAYSTEKAQVAVQTYDYAYQMYTMQQMNIDVAGVDVRTGIVDVIIDSDQYQSLVDMGYTMQVMGAQGIFGPGASRVDPLYKTPEEIEAFLVGINRAYPSITKLIQAGTSLEGRPIWVLKISDNVEYKEADEPAILFNSMHHAREVMTPEVAIDIIEVLTAGYGSDPKITGWVNDNEIWVMPMLNVDGNIKVWTEDNMWRKNARGGYGVDINRNYPYQWGACNGSSGQKNSQTYRGPFAASEPETQTIMNLVAQIRPVFDLSFHAYSELVIYPMGCDGERAVNYEVVEPIGKTLAKMLDYVPGTSWEILYSVDGGDIDWMNAEYQVIPYVFEVNSRAEGFQPDYKSTRDRTVLKVRPAWQYLLEQMQNNILIGQVRDNIGAFSGEGYIYAYKKIQGQYVYYTHYRLDTYGSFKMILPQGTYLLQNAVGQSVISQKEIVVSGTNRKYIALE